MASWSNTAGIIRAAAERTPRLTRDEELELARRHRRGDRAAGDRLITSHLRAVVRMAHRYRGYGIPVEDLIGEGSIGLVEATRRFEPERGLRFLTYARHWIRARILGHVLKQHRVVATSTSAQTSRLFFGLQREHARLAATLGDDEGAIEARLAERFEVPVDTVRTALARHRGRDVSLDAPVSENGDRTLGDVLADEALDPRDAAEVAETVRLVHEAIAAAWPCLDERERMVLKERLVPVDGRPRTLAELGRRAGVSRERMRQIESGIKGRLRREYERIAELPRQFPECS